LSHNKSFITWKQIAAIVSSFAAIVALGATLHANIMMPSVMRCVEKAVKQGIKEHSERVHPGALTQKDIEMFTRALAAKDEMIMAAISELKQDIRLIDQRLDQR